ncbi:hypothetical protein PH547_02860 [Rhizobium sp. CNPSo 3464]|uniref:hypothetical protein n=1 Tax=Rhizobium sp. CNPSo 3464 TaxID=3021406 RepID=UPI00254EBA84|nr:hypothetical protein [Rhizobium sp. CNPSo 3464]MDK4737803.1 hypothetical protein [Rhizobium sp. CNPSo 3464]
MIERPYKSEEERESERQRYMEYAAMLLKQRREELDFLDRILEKGGKDEAMIVLAKLSPGFLPTVPVLDPDGRFFLAGPGGFIPEPFFEKCADCPHYRVTG